MDRWFMTENGKHHRVDSDEGLILHYPNTCNLHDLTEVSSKTGPFAPRKTAIDMRLAPSRVGWVAICYETKGVITFFAQIDSEHAAWQRIEWTPNFDQDWDDGVVQRAIENFLWVAECEVAQSVLPKP